MSNRLKMFAVFMVAIGLFFAVPSALAEGGETDGHSVQGIIEAGLIHTLPALIVLYVVFFGERYHWWHHSERNKIIFGVAIALLSSLLVLATVPSEAIHILEETAIESAVLLLAALGYLITTDQIKVKGNFKATPKNIVISFLAAIVIAPVFNTVGAVIIVGRFLARSMRERTVGVAFIITAFIAVAGNGAGGYSVGGEFPTLLLKLLGVDPTWPLRTFAYFVTICLYITGIVYVVDTFNYRKESASAKRLDQAEQEPLRIDGNSSYAFIALMFLVPIILVGMHGLEQLVALLTYNVAIYFLGKVVNGKDSEDRKVELVTHRVSAELFAVLVGLMFAFASGQLFLDTQTESLPFQTPEETFTTSYVGSSLFDNTPWLKGTVSTLATMVETGQLPAENLLEPIDAPEEHVEAGLKASVWGGTTTKVSNFPNVVGLLLFGVLMGKSRTPSTLKFTLFMLLLVPLPAFLLAFVL